MPATAKPVAPDATAKEGQLQQPPTGHKEDTPLLDLFFSSDYSVWLLVVLAVLFGAAHALTPGHGKTLMAAYLVGEQGTVAHALVLGLVTTLTHTGAVIIVAIALRFVPREDILFALDSIKLLFGLLIVGIGVWLLLCRLSGRADHVHIGGGHHHHHHDHGHGHHHHHDNSNADHDHDEHGHVVPRKPGERVSVWRLTVLGMQGGIVPCWDAIVMLFLAIAANLLWLALPLLLAFSAGLAGVLVLIGIAVVTVKQFAQSRWGENRLIKALPVVSACIVIGLGLWLCCESVHGPDTHSPRGQVNASR
jgi:ABC-type nickel/cobalt efflux system permease component RcnA